MSIFRALLVDSIYRVFILHKILNVGGVKTKQRKRFNYF